MSFGVTAQGFIRKTYSDIVSELQSDYRIEFGDDVDLSDYSPVGMELKLRARSLDLIWQRLEEVYYSHDLDSAEGIHLDRLTKLGFVNRKGSQFSIVVLEFVGDPTIAIPIGTQAETASGIVFETIEEGSTDSGGRISLQCIALISGSSGNVPAGSITNLKTPIAGIDEVNNPDASTGGRGIETDAEERQRYKDLPAATGSSVAAVEAAVSALEGVGFTSLYENKTNMTDANGLPAKSFEIIVEGGIDSEIAATIFNKGPGGIESFGNISETVVDLQGVENIVKFSRPESVDVYVTVDITKNADWDDQTIDMVKIEILEYIGGVDSSGNEYDGVGTGGTVRRWKIIASLEEFNGIDYIDVKLGLAENPTGTIKLPFLSRQRPVTDLAKIVVNPL